MNTDESKPSPATVPPTTKAKSSRAVVDLDQRFTSVEAPFSLYPGCYLEKVRRNSDGCDGLALSFLCQDGSPEQAVFDRYVETAQQLSQKVQSCVPPLAAGDFMGQPTLILKNRGADWEPFSRRIGQSTYLNLRLAVEKLECVFSAIAQLHDAGIALRFLNPDVIWDEDQRTWIRDLGTAIALSHMTDSLSIAEVAQHLSISACYVAPELNAAPGTLDYLRCDVYSLGVLAYEFITGHRPFSGSRKYIEWQHETLKLVPIRQLRPDCPHAVARLIEACLSINPVERPPSAKSLLADWRQATISNAGHDRFAAIRRRWNSLLSHQWLTALHRLSTSSALFKLAPFLALAVGLAYFAGFANGRRGTSASNPTNLARTKPTADSIRVTTDSSRSSASVQRPGIISFPGQSVAEVFSNKVRPDDFLPWTSFGQELGEFRMPTISVDEVHGRPHDEQALILRARRAHFTLPHMPEEFQTDWFEMSEPEFNIRAITPNDSLAKDLITQRLWEQVTVANEAKSIAALSPPDMAAIHRGLRFDQEVQAGDAFARTIVLHRLVPFLVSRGFNRDALHLQAFAVRDLRRLHTAPYRHEHSDHSLIYHSMPRMLRLAEFRLFALLLIQHEASSDGRSPHIPPPPSASVYSHSGLASRDDVFIEMQSAAFLQRDGASSDERSQSVELMQHSAVVLADDGRCDSGISKAARVHLLWQLASRFAALDQVASAKDALNHGVSIIKQSSLDDLQPDAGVLLTWILKQLTPDPRRNDTTSREWRRSLGLAARELMTCLIQTAINSPSSSAVPTLMNAIDQAVADDLGEALERRTPSEEGN